jgi:hypothetical protein
MCGLGRSGTSRPCSGKVLVKPALAQSEGGIVHTFLVMVLPSAIGIGVVVHWRYDFLITRCLRSNHLPTWNSLGCPTPWRLFMTVSGNSRYFWWLRGGKYKELEDPLLTVFGRKQNALFLVICLLLLAWPVCAWFSGHLQLR